MYSRSLDNSRALHNDPRIVREYFWILKEVIAEFKIKPENIYNMDEKGFPLGLILDPPEEGEYRLLIFEYAYHTLVRSSAFACLPTLHTPCSHRMP